MATDATPTTPADIPGPPPGASTGIGARPVRNFTVDALRFFAMALVVLTHVLALRWEFKALAPHVVSWMVAFNMPLFAFLSGYVLLGREGSHPLKFLRGKALGLLVPYLAWILVELPIRDFAPRDWLPRLAQALVDPHAGLQMWFLWVLFVMFALFTASRLVSSSDLWTSALALALGALLFFPVPAVYGLDKVLWLYPFLVLGYLVARHREKLRRYDLALALAGIVAFPVLLALGLPGVPARFATALAGLVASWAAFRMLPATALRAQAWAGTRTLGLYGWQMVVLPFLIVGAGWSGAIASWLAVTAVALALTIMLERWLPTRAIFLGRWPKRARLEPVAA